jgi:RNA polymerase sigma-70 factor, ECF subfamily
LSDDETSTAARSEFEAVVREHHAKILALCLSILRDRASAEDAAQDAFLKAYRAFDKFQGKAALSTWLYRIATNRCLDLLRERARRKTEPLAEAGKEEGSGLETADLLSRLPDEQRAALALREVQGLSYEEIADALGCSVDAVKGRLKRARESLRHFLTPPGV